MEQTQKDHILKNINKLTKCTKNEEVWFKMLLEKQCLTLNIFEEIRNSNNTAHSMIRKAYLKCLQTPVYELLIQALKSSKNDNAANILQAYFAAFSPNSGKNKSKPIWFGMQSLTKYYKGREEELKEIHDCWLESCREDSLRCVVITGLGGIGKSELARKYAYKFYTEIQGHCIWINAESDSTYTDSLQKLAKKYLSQDDSGKEKTLDSLTYDAFNFCPMENQLIVFDNLENYELKLLECFLNYATKIPPFQPKPLVILTSRCQLLKNDFEFKVKQLELSVLPQTSSILFLKDALNISNENLESVSDLKTLCQELDHLPLAMQQAAAYINEKKRNSDVSTEIKEYLKIFKTESKSLLEHPLPLYQNRDSFSKTTYLTWQITLDRFKVNPKFHSLVILALNVISFLPSGNITVTLLKSIIRPAVQESADVDLKLYEGGPDICEGHSNFLQGLT